MHNLTVADFHTYYVLAGVTPVLVHNSTACGPAQSVHNLKEVVAPKPLKPAQVEKAWSRQGELFKASL